MAFKVYYNVAKQLKLKVKRFFGLIRTFGEIAGEKLEARVYVPLVVTSCLRVNGRATVNFICSSFCMGQGIK